MTTLSSLFFLFLIIHFGKAFFHKLPREEEINNLSEHDKTTRTILYTLTVIIYRLQYGLYLFMTIYVLLKYIWDVKFLN